MIEVEEVTRRFSRVYRCPDDIANFKLRIKLLDVVENVEEKKTFGWQEKKYSRFEREFYSDSTNCVTELEKKYHEDVKNLVDHDEVVYSYVKEDDYQPEENPVTGKNVSKSMKQTNVNEEVEDIAKPTSYDFEDSLQASYENPYDFESFETMYIMADFGEYYEDTWLKSEHVLCCLKYDKKRKLMVMFPDYAETQPYVLKINTDTSKLVTYWLENASLDGASPEELQNEAEILNQVALYERKLRSEKITGIFKLPPKNKLDVHLFLEILTAANFERADIYVQYCIDLPKDWSCSDPEMLRGVTPCCRGHKDDANVAHFGFPFEIHLEYNIQEIREGYLQCPFVYFEVISKDTWSRFRTEGLTYLKIPIAQPGLHNKRLQCLRLAAGSSVGDLRRFFIGDCSNCNDLTWIAIPRNHQGNTINKFNGETIGTGHLDIRMNVVHQSHAFLNQEKSREKLLMEKLNDSNLVKSVEQVIDAFKKARSKMLEARKKI